MSNTNPTIDAVGYARVSTDRQGQDGHSIESQRARIQAWADALGKTIVIFEETGSGKDMSKRDRLQAALGEAKRNRCPLVVYSTSRLTRNAEDGWREARRLQSVGAEIISLTENIDTTTPMGRFVFGIMLLKDQLDRETTGQRTSDVLQSRKAAGYRISGHAPYGYRHVQNSEPGAPDLLEIDEAEQANIARIVEMHDQGFGYQETADRLNQAGIAYRNGNPWTRQAVYRVVTREA